MTRTDFRGRRACAFLLCSPGLGMLFAILAGVTLHVLYRKHVIDISLSILAWAYSATTLILIVISAKLTRFPVHVLTGLALLGAASAILWLNCQPSPRADGVV